MTYSIVARCPDTGMLGVAVQTRYFAVGNIVPWVKSGIGAIATQATGERAHGYRGTAMLSAGLTAEEVITVLKTHDPGEAKRQLAIVSADGRTASHTGKLCTEYAGTISADGVVFAGNLLTGESVLLSMQKSWETSRGEPFLERLLLALEAGEASGGDLRGQQSAAVKIAGSDYTEGWDGVVVDLRVDDHSSPLVELRRLARLRDAYLAASEGEALYTQGDFAASKLVYEKALSTAPEASDIAFDFGAMLLKAGEKQEAAQVLKSTFAVDRRWETLFERLCDAEAFGSDSDSLRRLAD